jgi:glycosyltransferase involved in cell wall biosynthesis
MPAAAPLGREHAGRPKLSVTVLNYNYGRYLPACLDSILQQTFRDFELIVVDDCSTDGSLDALARFAGDPRVRVVAHKQNRGYLASLIEGTEVHSQGEYITVISADDLVRSPTAFERQLALLDAHPDAGFCFAHYDKLLGDDATLIGTRHSNDADGVTAGGAALRRLIGDPMMRVLHTGTIIRRSTYGRAGGYRRDIDYAVDLAMWLSLSLHGDAAYVAAPLYGYRTHDAQMSGSMHGYRALMRETFRLVDDACRDAGFGADETSHLQRAASRSFLFGWAMDEAFHGARIMPLRRCLAAVGMRPAHSLTSIQLWVIVTRALLGRRGFAALRSIARPLRRPLRRGVQAARRPASAADR